MPSFQIESVFPRIGMTQAVSVRVAKAFATWNDTRPEGGRGVFAVDVFGSAYSGIYKGVWNVSIV